MKFYVPCDVLIYHEPTQIRRYIEYHILQHQVNYEHLQRCAILPIQKLSPMQLESTSFRIPLFSLYLQCFSEAQNQDIQALCLIIQKRKSKLKRLILIKSKNPQGIHLEREYLYKEVLQNKLRLLVQLKLKPSFVQAFSFQSFFSTPYSTYSETPNNDKY